MSGESKYVRSEKDASRRPGTRKSASVSPHGSGRGNWDCYRRRDVGNWFCTEGIHTSPNADVERDEYVASSRGASLHTDKRGPECRRALSLVCQRDAYRGGTYPHGRRRFRGFQADLRGHGAERVRGRG